MTFCTITYFVATLNLEDEFTLFARKCTPLFLKAKEKVHSFCILILLSFNTTQY